MEHRLGDPGPSAGESAGGVYGGGVRDSNSGQTALSAAARDNTYVVNAHRQPTARFVDANRPSASPSRVSSATSGATRRKVSRLDDKDSSSRPSSSSNPNRHRRQLREQHAKVSSSTSQPHHAWLNTEGASASPSTHTHHHHHQQRNTSPKRVDFSQRLRLREVKWDGTYQDSVAHNTNPNLYAHTAPVSSFASASSSVEPDSQSTLTDSRAIRETEIRFLNDTYATDPLRQLDHVTTKHHHHRAPRLTHVDVDLPGSGSLPGSSSKNPVRQTGHAEGRDPKHSRTHPTYGHGVHVLGNSGGNDMSSQDRLAGGDMGDYSSGGDSEKGAVGGAERSPRGATGSSRQQKIKKTLKDLPQDDNILTQLREKIRQQRLSASSTDTSQNDSMASSLLNSDASRELTPRHTLHDAQEAIRLGEEENEIPHKLPRSRKVAAGPPTPSYRGFSETQMDPRLQATVKKVNRLTAPKTKKSGEGSGGGGRGGPGGGVGGKVNCDPVQHAIQAQLEAHGYHSVPITSSSVQPASTSTPAPNRGVEKPRKTARLVTQGGKTSKSAAKSVITTSSWRVGQEVVARELGLPKPKHKEEPRRGAAGSSDDPRRPDGAEGNLTNSGRMPATGADSTKPSTSGKEYSAQLAQSRALSDDAKKLFSDLQLENDRTPARPAVKRKAPKERETEKPEPVEKQRHYDSDAVRQFMAKQKAERLKQEKEARKAEELERQKKHQLMQELINKQRSAAVSGSNTKVKKVKRAGKSKQRVLFPPDHNNAQAIDQRIQSLLGGEREDAGRGMEVDEDEDNSDADTLTGESEGSTPRATPVNTREEGPERRATYNLNTEHNFRPHTDLPPGNPISDAFTAVNSHSLPTSHAPCAGTTIEFQGKKLNLDVDSVLTRFSQVVNQRQGREGVVGGQRGVAADAFSSSTDRNRQDRLQNLKASSKDLMSKIASASVEIKQGAEAHSGGSADSSEAEIVPRYDRIAGSRDNFHVFTSGLPGAETAAVMARTASADRTPGAGGRTSTLSHRDSASVAAPKASPLTLGGFNQTGEDDDSVTETSTFSEVTAAVDEWDTNTPRRKPTEGTGQKAWQGGEGKAENTAQYRAPTSGTSLRWQDPQSDPYNVLNIFSRHQRYGVRDDHSSRSQPGGGRVKEPSVISSQQVTVGHTAEGHPIMTTTTYTRMEATIPDPSQASQPSTSARHRTSRSEDRSAKQTSFPSRVRSISEDTQSLESEEEDSAKPGSNHVTPKKWSGAGYRRQMSDTGQETDVSQLSEDEPRLSLRTYERPIVDVSQQEGGEARWSPAALERQMAAELARLESLEDSIRQLSSAERTRAVALAQQETVSVAQVLKARQQAHSAELRSLQLQVQEERVASAQQLQQQLEHSKGVQAPASDMASLALPQPAHTGTGNKQLLEQAENRRPETKGTTTSLSRSRGRDDTEYSETFTSVRDSKHAPSHSVSSPTATHTASSRTRTSASLRTAEDSATSIKAGDDESATSIKTAEDSAASIKTAEDSAESLKTAEDSQLDSDSSIKTASDSEHQGAYASARAQQVAEEDYSMSFDESVTEDESLKEGRSSEGHRKDAKRRKSNKMPLSEGSSVRVTDLTSMYGGDASFNRLSIDMVRNTMREEEMRAQHQESLLRIRAKALKEKTKAQLSLLKQERQQWQEKGQAPNSDKAHKQLQRLADKEKAILKEQEEHKAEIDRMFKSEELAREHRHSLLKQYEQIAKMQAETQEKMQQLQGRLGQAAQANAEDDTSMVEDLSDASDVSYAKDSKSDSETMQRKAKVRGDKQKMEKQQKLRLDQKYLTVREQKLMERKKQASELLRWKQDLDAEEEKVLQMERNALQAWQGRVSDKPSPTDKHRDKDNKREETDKKVKAAGNLRPEPAATRSEGGTTPRTPRTGRTDTATTPRSAADSYTAFSQSEPVSTHISASETQHKPSPTDSSTPRSRAPRSRSSETSIAEDVPDGSEIQTQMESSPDKRVDSSDDTIINSSVNEEEETEVRSKGKKSPVETQSDVSDYEVRIRQLSDMLRRRRKEADMLKKERSRRMKEKLRAQEESLKKQVEAYEMYIAQVKKEQADLEHEGGKPTVPPKIKQPGPNAGKTRTSPSSSPSPSRTNRTLTEDTANYSSSFDGTDSNHNSPALSQGSKPSPPSPDKGRKKSSSTIMDRISEGSESRSEQSGAVVKKGGDDRTTATRSISEASSLSEAIEEAVDSVSAASDSAALNIKTSEPAKADVEKETSRPQSVNKSVTEDVSYSQDFSDAVSHSLAKSHNKLVTSQASAAAAPKSEVSEMIESAVSTAQSDSSAAPRFNLKRTSGEKEKDSSVSSSRPATGIQESDSESESRLNSHRTLSRPSSERSTASTNYSDLHDFDQEEEDDIISSESDRTPVKISLSQKEKSSAAHSVKTEEDISEHISASLPSISEKKTSMSQATALGHQNSIDADLLDLLGDEDATPTHTPRAESPGRDQVESGDPLLMTDPLADFHEGDPVVVWGHLAGTLRFKGVVAFAPGYWAGVELKTGEGDTDGQREGKRYFSCPPQHGLLVPGSEISAAQGEVVEGGKTPEESFTEQDEDDVSSATEADKSELVSVTEEIKVEEDTASTAVQGHHTSPRVSRPNLNELADDITASLTKSLVEDSLRAVNSIAARQSPPEDVPPPKPQVLHEKTPPPTLPKPTHKEEDTNQSPTSPEVKTPPPTLPKPQTSPEKTLPPTMPKPQTSPEKTPPPTLPKPQSTPEKSPPPTLPKPEMPSEKIPPATLPKPKVTSIQEREWEKQEKVQNTTSNMVDGLLNDAISKMIQIHRSRQSSAESRESALVNGLSDDSGVDPSHDSSLDPAHGVSPEPDPMRDGVSPDPFQRPKSPVPLNAAQAEEDDDDEYDFSGLGDSQDFFDEDFGLSAKPPPPYPGPAPMAREAADGADSPRPAAKLATPGAVYIVPHERSEVESIVSDALAVYWNMRRCGEAWESATAPPDFLTDASPDGSGEHAEGMVSASRRTYKQLIFDLTGDIIRDIYQHENDTEPPPWQKASQKRQRYFKGSSPPSTMDVLLPIVQSAVGDILGVNGCSGRFRGKTANKWNVRKKKDHVDAVLVEELQEEEADWINYDDDEMAVKMQLTETLFDSLLADTVATLNKVYSKKQRLQTS